jgi:hypothetical protein
MESVIQLKIPLRTGFLSININEECIFPMTEMYEIGKSALRAP